MKPFLPKRILVVGADGLIGRTLVSALDKTGHKVFATSRGEKLSAERIRLDLEDKTDAWSLPENVDVAFLCAAYNSLDLCRREPIKTRWVNVEQTVKLARHLARIGSRVIFLSTNLVYDGATAFARAGQPTCPQTEHGRQKAAAEKQLLKLGNVSAVLRLTKVFGPDMPLLQEWATALRQNKAIHPFNDKVVSPLSLGFVTQILLSLSEKSVSGVLQVSGEKDITYADVAYRLAHRLGMKEILVQPISAKKSEISLEHLPAHTTLATTDSIVDRGMDVPAMGETVDEIIDQNIATLQKKSLPEMMMF